MNKKEYDRLCNKDMMRGMILDESVLTNKKDHTLLYTLWYSPLGDKKEVWHVYLQNRKIYTISYIEGYVARQTNKRILISAKEITISDNSCFVPDKDVYPECCDVDFCDALKYLGIQIPFTSFTGNIEHEVLYGYTVEDCKRLIKTPAYDTAKFRKSLFSLGDKDEFFLGYEADRTWANDTCPAFTKETCEKICDVINLHPVPDENARYDRDMDAFIVSSPELVDETNPNGIYEIAKGFKADTEDGPMHLYSFGVASWQWCDYGKLYENRVSDFVQRYLECVTAYRYLSREQLDDAYTDIMERCMAITGIPKIWEVPEYVDEYLNR